MDLHDLRTPAAYAAGLALTLLLCAYLTPRRWWRRPTARTLLITGAGAWCFGALLLQVLGPASAQAAATPADPAASGGASKASPLGPAAAAQTVAPPPAADLSTYTVHQDLNLRAGPGVHAERLATIPAGAAVAATGRRAGDWWQIRATVDGQDLTGWSSSLWLRRSGE